MSETNLARDDALSIARAWLYESFHINHERYTQDQTVEAIEALYPGGWLSFCEDLEA